MGVLMIIGLVVLAILLFSGIGLFLLKIGVIVNEASKPAHLDQGSYSLDQGREVRGEDQ